MTGISQRELRDFGANSVITNESSTEVSTIVNLTVTPPAASFTINLHTGSINPLTESRSNLYHEATEEVLEKTNSAFQFQTRQKSVIHLKNAD